MHFYDPETEPSVFDVVWCKWPRREDKLGPGPWTRCVLVIDVRRMVDSATDAEYSLVTACYGTGAENVQPADLKEHLWIPEHEFRALGLHKPTVFKLDLGNRKRRAWSPTYFVPPEYVKGQGIVAGSLSQAQIAKAMFYFQRHGMQFPLP